jgi:hypothetical protein
MSGRKRPGRGWDAFDNRNVGNKTAAERKMITKKSGYQGNGGPGSQCAMYFRTSAPTATHDESPRRFNDHVMSIRFAEMIRDGASVAHIRDMIDLYWWESYPCNIRRDRSKAAFWDFINNIDALHRQLEWRWKSEEMEAHRYDPNYWH